MYNLVKNIVQINENTKISIEIYIMFYLNKADANKSQRYKNFNSKMNI